MAITDQTLGGSHAEMQDAISLENVSILFGKHSDFLAIHEVSLRVQPGEFVSIVGPSGCGKTSLLRVTAGLLPPSSGNVKVLGGAPENAQKEKRIGCVFQEPALLQWLTAKKNIQLAMKVNSQANRGSKSAEELLRLVKLENFADARPTELSGGMQQRLALARTLALDPDVLLLDEPLGSLDEITREQMRDELLQIWNMMGKGKKKTGLLVTHSVSEAVMLSDRVFVMSPHPGRILGEIKINLPRPRQRPSRRSPVFLDAMDNIRTYLSENRMLED